MNLRRRSRSYIPTPEWQDCKINLLMLSTSSRAGTGTFTSRLPSPHSDPVQTVDWYFAPVLTRDFPMVRKIMELVYFFFYCIMHAFFNRTQAQYSTILL